jgi:hypothetical protein
MSTVNTCDHISTLKIPDSHRPIDTSGNCWTKTRSAYGQRRHGIDVSAAQFAHERLREHPIELRGRNGTDVFTRTRLRVREWIEIAMLGTDIPIGSTTDC